MAEKNQETKAKTLDGHKAEVQASFTRKKRIGMNLLKQEPGDTVYVEVKKHGNFVSTNFPDGIEYFDVVNMKTGEEQRMWVDGGLYGALNEIGGPEKAVGMKLEITRGQQKPIEVVNKQGVKEKAKVNSYEVFELN